MSDIKQLTVEEALSVLPNGETIHCFVSNGILLGADWSREDVEKYIKESETRQIGGPMCRGMGHGLVVYSEGGGTKFFEAEEEKLAKLEEK